MILETKEGAGTEKRLLNAARSYTTPSGIQELKVVALISRGEGTFETSLRPPTFTAFRKGRHRINEGDRPKFISLTLGNIRRFKDSLTLDLYQHS
jgi:hypothetical protein